MDASKQRNLIQEIMAAEVDEWDCAAVMDVIARYVELDPDAAEAAVENLALSSHLTQCGHCAEMHATLAELARLDEAGALPGLDALWKDLRQVLDEGSSEAASATSPETRRVKSVDWDRTRAARPSKLERLRIFSEGSGRPARLFRAAVLAALLLSSLGWARADGQLRGLVVEREQLQEQLRLSQLALASAESRVDSAETAAAEARASASTAIALAAHHETTIDLISQLNQMAFASRDDGAWARIVFDPEKNQAVVYVGNLPGLKEGQWVECWLKRRQDGRMISAGSSRELHPGVDHWMIDAESPFGDHSDFMLTIEPDHAPLFELPLVASDL